MWLLFALASAFCFASAGMIVRYSMNKNVRDPQGIIAIHAVGALVVAIVIWLISGARMVHGGDVLLAVGAGILTGLAAFGYFRAYTIDDASNVSLLQQMSIPMTIVLGYLVLGDEISRLQIIAVIIIILGVLLASKSHGSFRLRNKLTFFYILFATVCWAVMAIIMRHSVEKYDVYTFNLLLVVGYTILALLQSALHPPTKRGLKANLKPFSHRIVWVIVLAEVVFTVATLAQLKALSTTSAGLVTSVTASEVFFSLMIGLTLTKLMPHIIKEDIERGTVILKVTGACITVVGIVLINQ